MEVEKDVYIRYTESEPLELLRNHMLEICQALLDLSENDPTEVMGYPDDLKLRSSMTLFSEVTPEYDIFKKVLDKFYNGEKDQRTVEILEKERGIFTIQRNKD